MKSAAVLALLVCVGCGSPWAADYEGDPSANAVAAYEAVHGKLTESCAEQAQTVDVQFAEMLAVQHECQCTDCGGCMDLYDEHGGGHVWLMNDAPAYMVAHETEHVILACMRHATAGDPRHADPVWQDARLAAR